MTGADIYTGHLGESTLLDAGTIDGYRYAIVSLGSHPCAYVEVPEGHPYRRAYLDGSVRCHGGVTYFRPYAPPAMTAEQKIKSLWIGWDYAHIGDYLELPDTALPGKRYTLEEIQQEVRDVIAQLRAKESN